MNRALGAAAVAIVLAAGCREARQDGPLTVSGHVEGTEVRVGTKLAGRIATVAVDEGDEVAAGQVLATLDAVDYELSLNTARAERELARAELDLVLAGSRREDIAEARAGVAQADADLAAAERDLERMRALLDSGSGTLKERDDALARRDSLQARRAAAIERATRLERGFRPEEIAAARARLQTADARIAQLEQAIAAARVVSPSAGVVTSKLVEPGEVVAAGAPLVVITALDDVWLDVYLAEPEVPRIRIGQQVDVRTDDGATHRGTIRTVASRAEFTPKNVQTADERAQLVFKVRIGLDNAGRTFKPGMPAEARIGRASPAP